MEIVRREVIGSTLNLALFSDPHIGSVDADIKKFQRELSDAHDERRRMSFDGDLFDCIVPKDRKRFQPDVLAKRLRGRRDIINAALDWGEEIFSPYAGSIDMMGEGNHESKMEEQSAVNVTKLLVDRLRKYNPNIAYGGYTGFLDYRLTGTDARGYRFVIFYHHGGGGSSESQFRRVLQFADCDLVWVGHRHDRKTDGAKRLYCPLGGGEPIERTVRFAMTGSYLKTYRAGSTSYGAAKMYPPQDEGGIRVDVRVRNKKLVAEMRS